MLPYRRRRARVIPIILGALAVLLIGGGAAFAAVSMARGGFSFRPTATPTSPPPPTATQPPLPAGDTATPTPTFGPSPTNTPAPVITYTVELGDSLFTIAQEFSVDVTVLAAYNGIADPNTVQIGQVITIPPPDFQTATPTPLPTDLRPGSEIVYVVQPNDNLFSIASQFNSTVEVIQKRNQLASPDDIGAGQTLIIPYGIATPTPTPTPTPAPGAAPPTGSPAP